MSTAEPLLPRMLGRYALYEKIASGGMASVHIGRLLGPVGFARMVAIKRMHPHVAEDPEFVSMFLDEAHLASRVRHPNVIPTLDVVSMEGELFLVMDYVPGESLARLLSASAKRGARMSPEIAASIMAGVLHGLHAAHEARSDQGAPLDIVHRDVSPHNILVGTDGVARVLDFGVAKAAGRIQTTREGQLKGKLAYMAPEQVRGAVSRRTDVYAASIVLYEAVAGKRLFRGDNDAQILDEILRGCHEPPSAFAEGLPPVFDALTMRGLSVDPSARFSTAREMGCALEAALRIATSSQVGEWVAATAKDALEERRALVARIESGSSAGIPAPRATAPSLAARSATKPATPDGLRAATEPGREDTVVATEESIQTQLSSGSDSSPGRAGRRPRGPRWLAIAALGAGLLVATNLLVLATRGAPGSPSLASARPPEDPSVSVPSAASAGPSPSASSWQLVDAAAAFVAPPAPVPAAPLVPAAVPTGHAPTVGRPRRPLGAPPGSTPPSYDPMEHL
jgi:serine/threonine-protein kinase